MLKVEAAMVTSGAACAILLGTAASITGADKEKIRQIPNLPGPRPEVIMQKSHRYLFDQAVTTTGAKIVEVEGPGEMEKAFSEQTVMALFFNAAEKHSVTHEEFLAIAKRHKTPTFLDAAADVPPVENLFKFQKMGFDLVTFSGGKMIRGPQSAGLLFGRKDLIEAAKLKPWKAYPEVGWNPQTGAVDPETPKQGQEKIVREGREKIEREIKELNEGLQKETNPEVREKLSRMLQERKRQLESGEVYYFIRENRGAGLEAAKWARISMDQAVQIASSQYPGTALQCNLIGEREDKVYYHVMIVSGEEGNTTITHVMVNAIDGTIAKTEKELPRKQRSPE